MKFERGQKVVAIQKSIGDSMEECSTLHNAKMKNQPYLFYQEITKYNGKTVHKLNHVNVNLGDYFLDGDFIPYLATLSTGDMINALMANPEQKYELVGGTKWLNYIGTIAVNQNGYFQLLNKDPNDRYSIDLNRIAGALLNGQWTLVSEPPKPVDFLTAVKAYAEGKTIVCEWKEQKFTYTPRKYDARLIDNNKNTIGYTEILEGYWFIREE